MDRMEIVLSKFFGDYRRGRKNEFREEEKDFSTFVGPEGLNVYESTTKISGRGDTNVFENVLKEFDNYFAPKVCIGILRYKVFQRKQECGETVDEYVAALKVLVNGCKFDHLQSQLIRDQVVMHTRDPAIQERLWRNGDAELDDILAIVRKAELSSRSAKAVKTESKEIGEDTVNKIKYKETGRPKKESGKKQQASKYDGQRCYRCDSNSHLASYNYCPALKQKCAACGVIGNFARVCKKKKNNNNVKYVDGVSDNSSKEESKVNRIMQDSKLMGKNQTFVFNVHEESIGNKKKPVCLMRIGGVEIKCMLTQVLLLLSLMRKYGGQHFWEN
ncbi:hypothetical protein NDU88_002924 [Pleurodeles waltl]|uniref:Retrotransposon gag domain-containing protein n=1 Tax=Pleurodeles waltl TaxID=8319 RepID=A0AAV7QAA2_PLEWA|nr:hypothetical protein NDU88_002924 [Pleurodeles waltl]